MQWDFDHATYIPKKSCLEILVDFRRNLRYRKMLRRAETSVARELDLVKFIHRSRL